MSAGFDGPREGGAAAARWLRANRQRVIDLVIERLRVSVARAREQPTPILVNTFPAFLDGLAEAFDPANPRSTAAEGSTISSEHGGERARLTQFRPDDLIREYQVIRDVLLEVLEQNGVLSDAVRRTVLRSTDESLAQSCAAYFLVANRIREQFTLALTHDLRGPLSVISANAALILRRTEKPDVLRWASRIVENVHHADEMIRDVLDASRVEAGERLPLSIAEANLAAILREAAVHLSSVHGERFQVQAPEVLTGYCAAAPLRRALENLGTNAAKYGAPDLPITLSLNETNGRAVFRVHNHGSYIPAEQREALFQAFRRAESAKSGGHQGWGLGLAIVRGVAESHGGSVDVESLPEVGSTFIIDIPVDARPYQKAPVTE